MECPEAMERGRNFRLLGEQDLPELLEFLARYLPESVKFHQTLLTYMLDRVWDFHFYVANNWPDDGICLHFPGMTLSPHGLLYESVGVFCPKDRLDLLTLIREEDILIDWSKPLYINFVHYDIAEELSRLYEGTGTIDRVIGDVFYYELETGIVSDDLGELDGEADPDVQVLPLKAEHAEGIHELYPANDMECHELFLRLIRTLPAAGVFVKGSLAAWMVQSYYGAMFSMQTKPEHRRKGYGTKLARYLTQRVIDGGYRPFVVIRPENEASQNLYKKLGFKNLYQIVRMTFTPTTWHETENEATGVLKDNLENAIRELIMEQKVLCAFSNDKDISMNVETVEDTENPVAEEDVVVEEPESENIEGEEVVEESEERIEISELSLEDNNEKSSKDVEEHAEEVDETQNDDAGDQDDGGTGGGDVE